MPWTRFYRREDVGTEYPSREFPTEAPVEELLGEASGLDHRLEEAAAQSAAP